ncbi:MAG: lytic murein transglycosylase [Candidatus Tectomicrobia bacterium]|uniref:Lytic murein transglycosylase n=1 Tax=Tectimicrobiota bacterium TaxID=2528274 RepID=A0A932CM04_UNCTE|nr:lytic murein transglycosylase [Candidatus Tectomicrobia bacterium]
MAQGSLAPSTDLPFSSQDLAYQKVEELLEGSGVPAHYLQTVFSHPNVQIDPEVTYRLLLPAEKKDYSEYREIFITGPRIWAGARFYKEHERLVLEISRAFGVDPLILVSIVGVESSYGRLRGRFSVFNALYTIIHQVPRRAEWAARELAELLKFAYVNRVDPHSISGSYAGAFGYGQFIPSSFNRYAIDYDQDGVRRYDDWPDVLGSVANYLVRNGYAAADLDFSEDAPNWKALYAYNRSRNYVRVILELREEIERRLPLAE